MKKKHIALLAASILVPLTWAVADTISDHIADAVTPASGDYVGIYRVGQGAGDKLTVNLGDLAPVASPTFTGTVTAPIIKGGTGTTTDLTFQTTSGVGATGADMHFLVGNNGATEALTILNSGYVGIGTVAPSQLLSISYPFAKTDTTQRFIADFRSNEVTNPFGLTFGVRGAATLAGRAFTWQTADLNLANGGNLALQPSGGFVGVATLAPATALAVAGASGTPSLSADTTGLFTVQSSATNEQLQFGSLSGSPYSSWLQTKDSGNSGLAYPIALNPVGGNVGIGTTAPDGKLELNLGTAGASRLTYDDANGSAATYVDTLLSSAGVVTHNAVGSAPAHIWQAGGTEWWRINASGHLLAGADNTYDIGASGATRPRHYFGGGNISVAGTSTLSGTVTVGLASGIYWSGRTAMSSPADGLFLLTNNAFSDFNRLQLGGTTSAFPSVQRDGAGLRARLADDSAMTSVEMSHLVLAERSSDPSDPAEGKTVVWQSDGTGAGDDGDIMLKITAGGVTKTIPLVDFSAF